MDFSAPPVVIDNGTGYTKMGYAGNSQPQFVIPTVIGTKHGRPGGRNALDDLDFFIGDEALAAAKHYAIGYPVRHGQVDNWDWMEAFWAQSMFRYLRCNPEDHLFLLTEPPLNAPENRECTAEIMFETFNVPGLYIAVQAVLALAASWTGAKTASDSPLTGTVVDSGDGVTHIIPVVDGYAIGSAIKHVPVAGRNVTHLIQQMLRDRGIAPEDSLEVARRLKEECCYVCPDAAKELARLQSEPDKIVKLFSWTDPKSHKRVEFEVGRERFMGPEVFFDPRTGGTGSVSLPELVDSTIQACPIDCRRSLYKNVVLSGGSTMFRDFSKRLQRDVRMLVEGRLAHASELDVVNKSAGPLQVNVVAHRNQRYAVWSGGSLFASMDKFPAYCHSRSEYEECGPGIVRQSRVFGSLLA